MKFKVLILLICTSIFYSCEKETNNTLVSNVKELSEAIKNAKAGDNIVLKNGIYKDIEINFIGEGTKENPITLKAETSGEVFIEGVSNLEISGNYLVVDGLFFRNGHSPTKNVIAFRTSKRCC